MFLNRSVVVVVPCYNVGRHLPDVVRTMPAFVDHVVIVDDGSAERVTDLTLAAGTATVTILRHERNHGLARAMETGFRKALELGADIVVKVDGDGQMDPLEMKRLLAPIAAGHADMAKGNRFLNRRHLAGMPWTRLAGNLALSFLTKLASGYWHLFDPTNGYVAVRRQVLEDIDLSRLGPRYFFEISLLCQAFLAGAVVRDVAIPARYAGEHSALSLRWTITVFPFLLARACIRRIALQHFIRDFTPVALLLLAGVASAGGGLWYGLNIQFRNASLHQATPPGTLVIVALPLVVGFQLLLQAFVMDIGSVPTRSPWADLDN